MKEKIRAKFADHKDACFLILQVLCLSLGIFFAYPGQGIAATSPLGFGFLLLAFLFGRRAVWLNLLSPVLAFFYASAMGFASPGLFAAALLFQGILACFAARGLQLVKGGRRRVGTLLFFLLLALSLFLTYFTAGSPGDYVSARAQAKAYLAQRYPDQRFSRLDLYYRWEKKGYQSEAFYEYQGNLLSSSLFFGDEVEDGFDADLTLWMQEKRKSALIEVLAEENVILEAQGMIPEEDVRRGAYGDLSSMPTHRFLFSATFREEKPERRRFAEAVAESLSRLQSEDFAFGAITFYGLDAGKTVYRCTVSFETEPDVDVLLSRITRP